jgi:hypothetical protein
MRRLTRLIWFVGIYAASIAALGIVTLAVRAFLRP